MKPCDAILRTTPSTGSVRSPQVRARLVEVGKLVDPCPVRRTLMLMAFAACGVTAFAACERRPPEAASDRPIEALAIGRSGEAAPPPVDAGLVGDERIDPPARPASGKVTWTGCHIEANGMSGGISADAACVIEQEYDSHASDAGRPFLGIWDSPPRVPGDPDIRIGVWRQTVPLVGVQPSTAFDATVRIVLDKGVWIAESRARNLFGGTTTGKLTLTFTSVHSVRDSGVGAYELHGKLDAQLIPDWQGTATGFIELHVDF